MQECMQGGVDTMEEIRVAIEARMLQNLPIGFCNFASIRRTAPKIEERRRNSRIRKNKAL